MNKPDIVDPKVATIYNSEFVDQATSKNVKKHKINFLKKGVGRKNMEKGRFDMVNQLVWITPGLVFIMLFTLYSIFIVFKDGFNGSVLIDNFVWSLNNFKIIAADKSFGTAIGNSFLYVIISVPLSILISLFVAKALSNILNKRIFSFLQSLFFMPFVTTALAVSMGFSMIFSGSSNSLLNQLMAAIGASGFDPSKPSNAKFLLLLYGLWRMLPFQIIMFTAAFTGVNKKLYHAASIDGVPKWKQFWTISIPQIIPIIIYMITTGIIGAFKYMPLGLFNSYSSAEAAEAQTMVYYIYHKITEAVNYGLAGAASIILMAIILAMTILNTFLTKWLNHKYR